MVVGLGYSLGTSYTYVHPLEAEHTTALICTLDFIILSEIGEPLVNCLSDLASCGTSWAIWVGGVLVTISVCQHLDGPVIGGSSSEGR